MPPKKAKKELSPEDKKKQLNKHIEALNDLITKTPVEISQLKGELELIKPLNVKNIIEMVEDEIADLEDELAEAKETLEQVKSELASL